jgi:hypothetical protein
MRPRDSWHAGSVKRTINLVWPDGGDMIRKNNDLLGEKLTYLTDHIIIRVRNLVIFYMRMLRFVANFTCVFDKNFSPNLRIYAIRKLI